MSLRDQGPITVRPEAVALRALAAGVATAEQQKAAFAYIGDKLSRYKEPSFVPGDPNLTAFNEGRRSVGLSIERVLAIPVEKFPEVNHG